ncbi:GNAT family N-acetyltransferase [Niallia taxi]|uniref:GNAT family N-acetyltransferase n=1 Tax=Niallia taxi TaxID=2499688 RepID=UPI0015F4ECA6|nr:GNAT family N-acetyltransferase [Niallia taxi]
MYDSRASKSFRSIIYVESDGSISLNFDESNPVTCEVSGRVAYIHRLVIEEKYRGKGWGTLALQEILMFLRNSFLVENVLLFPYPIEHENLEEPKQDSELIAKDTDRLIKFYEKFRFKKTYGALDEFYLCLNLKDFQYMYK